MVQDGSGILYLRLAMKCRTDGYPASFRVEWTVKSLVVLIIAKDLLKYHYNKAQY